MSRVKEYIGPGIVTTAGVAAPDLVADCKVTTCARCSAAASFGPCLHSQRTLTAAHRCPSAGGVAAVHEQQEARVPPVAEPHQPTGHPHRLCRVLQLCKGRVTDVTRAPSHPVLAGR